MRLQLTLALAVGVLGCAPPRTDVADGSSPIVVPDAGSDAGYDTRSDPPVVTPAPQVTVDTLAGSSVNGSMEGAPTEATFDNPVGVIILPDGDLLISEYDGGRVRRIPKTGSTTTVARGLYEPFALLQTEDALYIQTDRDKFGEKGPTSGTIWRQDSTGGDPVLFLEGLTRPRGLVRTVDGRVLIADRDRHTLSLLNLADKSMTLLAGSGKPGLRDGTGTAARLNEPYGVALMPDGTILVADHGNHCIRKVTVDGYVSVYAGDGNPGMRDDPDKLNARFDGPVDVSVDAAGNAFVSDGGNHRIRRITTSGVVDTVAGDGERGFNDGPAATARFYGQEQLEVTADGKTIYVTDGNGGDGTAYHRVRRIHLP